MLQRDYGIQARARKTKNAAGMGPALGFDYKNDRIEVRNGKFCVGAKCFPDKLEAMEYVDYHC
ncbi:MAG: hypothetical protein QF511_13270 [Rhodospirillales bacterium]|jgi:hypothetical protein|nr:hypothetical protein [Rhodospirillales bacterium]